ncbi:MAG: N-acetylneuraminate synthase family protein [Candidatus Wildermuthbacteria bacterium]|nr:N-acetylneuraminate synthase family protein [Candidatus Wildermuthbacteria bacterium]
MTKDIIIGNKTIGIGKDIFISAEVGTTCNGDPETAKKLIDAAVEAGMDAVKFQILNPQDKYSDKTLPYTYTRYNGEEVTENIYEMLKQYVMSKEQWLKIKQYADRKGIIMFATPDHLEAVDLMESLDMPAYKIATWDVSFYPLVRKIAKLRKPAILDFGASTLQEIAFVLQIFEEEQSDRLILVHCYHTKNYGEMNVRTIEFLRETFGYLSGFSASDENNEIDYLSLAYNPVYIEKRLTLDRKDPRHHHSRALEPDEMKAYVKKIRELFSARGNYTVKPTAGDLKDKQVFFRRIVAKKDIHAGEILKEEHIACRRPLRGGIDALQYPFVLGRTIRKDIKENEPITWDMI